MPLEPMVEATRKTPTQVREAAEAVEAASLAEGSYASVALCGMGGSSIGGTLAARLLDREVEIPMAVVRDHEPPAFVGEDTLVVATSYSGNTQETVDAARASLDRGADLVAITTGGKLGTLAEEVGAPWIEVPSGYEPRAAIGWLWAANHLALSARLGLDEAEAVRDVADELEARIDDMAPEGGRADQLAGQLGEGPIGVVGHDLFGVVARRWAAEISENAKRLAFHATLPEAAHNQIVGWDGEPGDATLVVVGREDEGELEAARTRFFAERARKAGAPVVEARVHGDRREAALAAVLLGDLVSLQLARRDGVDPEPVSVIDDLKDRLADALP